MSYRILTLALVCTLNRTHVEGSFTLRKLHLASIIPIYFL